MNVLVMLDRVGPLVGLVLDEVRAAGYNPIVFNLKERHLYGVDVPVPAWLDDDGGLESARWFNAFVSENGVGLVLGIGIWPSCFAARCLESQTVISILQPGELDFAKRRSRAKAQAFDELSTLSAGLILLNEWEMSKATSLGSKAPHFLWDLSSSDSTINMLDDSAECLGVVVDPEDISVPSPSMEAQIAALKEVLSSQGKKVKLVSANSFYWYKDFTMGRSFRNVMRLRGQEFSSLYFVGGGADSLVVAASQNAPLGRNFAVERIESRLLARNHVGLSVFGIDKLVGFLENPDGQDRKSTRRPLGKGRSLFSIVDTLLNSDIPRYWEDYGDFDEFSLFFSVAAVENRSNGARPQRIRNLYLEMADNWVTLQIAFSAECLGRRSKLVKHWLESGKRCVLIYGENSTNPVQGRDEIIQVYRLLDLVSFASQAPSLWFVRDLHWLDLEMFPDGPPSGVLESGLFELQRLGDSFGALIAPSLESREMFERLLADNQGIVFIDDELPPGLTDSSCALVRGHQDGTTFVYSGGIGAAYRMDSYLKAVAAFLDETNGAVSAYFDFVVRPQEEQALFDQLEGLEINGSPSIRVLNGEFKDYRPRTKTAYGVLLLESDYGKGAFPYKSVSYLEKGFPILCFEDSPVHRLFGGLGVTFGTQYGAAAVKTAIYCALERENSVSWQEVWKQHSWAMRLEKITSLAVTAVRELR